ncbi:putative mitochondrial protein [Cucumis melo var. makuwa]|uniref:Putative mitochondrial protein n=1 Tax=Cucumis melo var. makuwa TaxID=1194695 RepID=A0A5D3BCC3_CUCMM|nr:putative mitochondrial protein [Cucumis melo var. makuwa]
MIDDAMYSIMISSGFLGFVHDRRCYSIMMPFCLLGFVLDSRCVSIMTPSFFLGFVHDIRSVSITTASYFLGFVHDSRCVSIMTPSCFSGFVHDKRCNSIMSPSYFLVFVHDKRCNSIITPSCLLGIMVYFTKRLLSGVRHLVVFSDKNQPREDGLSFLVEKPWAGSFADHWPRLYNNSILHRLSVELSLSEGKTSLVLQSSIHNEAPNFDRALTLEQRLIESQTYWAAMTKVPEEFYFTDCYWEWLELVVAFCEAWCPSTSTLHTRAGSEAGDVLEDGALEEACIYKGASIFQGGRLQELESLLALWENSF